MKKWLCLALALLTLTACVWAAAESTDWNYDLNYAILRGYNGAGAEEQRRLGVRKHDERHPASEPGRHQPNELFQLHIA